MTEKKFKTQPGTTPVPRLPEPTFVIPVNPPPVAACEDTTAPEDMFPERNPRLHVRSDEEIIRDGFADEADIATDLERACQRTFTGDVPLPK